MSACITAKRARVELEDDPGSGGPERKRDEELWYEDGNIILIAGDTEFRVFKGILSDHSPVFKDMLSLPQPSPASPAELACPVVHVTDSPQDLRHILRLCMPKMGPSPFEPSDPSFDTISASIRLGHKYQIAKLVEHSMAYLRRYYPGHDGYDDWIKSGRTCPPSFEPFHAIGVVNLATLVDDNTLLPAALLACCKLGTRIVDGFEREDGSRDSLSPEYLGPCFLAKSVLTKSCYVNAGSVYGPTPSPDCQRGPRCVRELHAMLREFLSSSIKLLSADPVTLSLSMFGGSERRLCGPCHNMVEDRDERVRRLTRDCLPDLLGIEVEGWGLGAVGAS